MVRTRLDGTASSRDSMTPSQGHTRVPHCTGMSASFIPSRMSVGRVSHRLITFCSTQHMYWICITRCLQAISRR